MTHSRRRTTDDETKAIKRSRPGLVRARLQRGLTQEQAADQIGAALGTWARWERGVQEVRPFYRKRLADRWDVTPDEVEAWLHVVAEHLVSASCAHEDTGLDAEAAFHASGVETAEQLWRWEMDTSRRHLLMTLPFVPAALGEWLLAWRFDQVPHVQPALGEGSAVGMTDVQRVHEARQAFSQMDHQFGAGLVRPAVTDFMNFTLTPLLRGAASEQVRGQLLSAAAGMTLLAGWMAFDLGRQGQAQAHFGQALGLAKQAGDDLAAARVLATMAQQACDLGHGRWAARLAGAAVEAGRSAGASPRVMAMLTVRQARAEAVIIESAEQRGAHARGQVGLILSQAEHYFAQGTRDHDPIWTISFDQAELAAEAGYCWQLVGEHRKAADLAEQALAGFDTGYARSIQFNRVHAAHAYLDLGDLDRALAVAAPAVPSTKELTSARAVVHLQAFAVRAQQSYRDNRYVRDFAEYLRAELSG